MSVIYHNRAGKRIELVGDQTLEEISNLLERLIQPESTLIAQLPSGLGLDFQKQEDGMLWVEFYADEISSAIVSAEAARQILQRAFEGATTGIKEKYGDLVPEWIY